MIFSRAVPVGRVEFPEFTGMQLHMRSINTSWSRDRGHYVEGVPEQYHDMVALMLTQATADYRLTNNKVPYGELYLTIDERDIPAGETHRRGGVHYDGAYFVIQHKDSRWNTINRSEVTQGAGMIIAASHQASHGWRGELPGVAGPGGDCDHLRAQLSDLERFYLEANTVYHGNATFLHESLPVAEPTRRQLVRITYSNPFLGLNPRVADWCASAPLK
jgi:hypothetical protein